MEPQLFSRGNIRASARVGCEHAASMEPQLFSRGNSHKASNCLLLSCCFNGAAAFQPRKLFLLNSSSVTLNELQWSRSFSAAEISHAGTVTALSMPASMEPQLFSRGNLLDAIDPSNPPAGFNGAAAFQPRKCAPISGGAHSFHHASMEPQLFSRGNLSWMRMSTDGFWGFNGAAAFQPRKSSTSESISFSESRFNGAAAFQPRKSAPRRGSRTGTGALQWSRSFSAAEIGPVSGSVNPGDGLQWSRSFSAAEIRLGTPSNNRDKVASMEPQLFSRGNMSLALARKIEAAVLQWSRSFSAAEICFTGSPPLAMECFNGAAAFQPRKCTEPGLM